jgi:hypothetical protein
MVHALTEEAKNFIFTMALRHHKLRNGHCFKVTTVRFEEERGLFDI